MASVTDTIVNAVIILIVFTIISVIVANNVVKNTAQDTVLDRDVLLEEQLDLSLDAILVSSEPDAGMSLAEMIGISVLSLNTQIRVGDDTIDVLNATQERMDEVFGKGNYYLRVEPAVKGVSLMFVLDSSRTVEEERNTIASELEYVQEQIKDKITITGDEKVVTKIFLLPTESDSFCDTINALSLADTSCEQWNEQTLYQKLNIYDWEKPGFGFGSFENWQAQNHFATTQLFAQSDWAAGVANAALEYQFDAYLRHTTNLNLIFPLSDELTTTSKADSCFNQLEDWMFTLCQLCAGTCPAQRSEDMVNQSIQFAKDSNSIVFPIYSVNCDFTYFEGWNTISSLDTPYTRSFLDPPQAPILRETFPDDSWCHQNACPGCDPITGYDRNNPLFCFHSNCHAELQRQMEYLANETDGEMFNVDDAQNIPDAILAAFDRTIAHFNFTIGWQDEWRDRYVYKKVIPLPNGALSSIELWIYLEPPRTCLVDEPCETDEGCPGMRACIDGNLSDSCVKDDPLCQGRPCTGPELCLDEDECMGFRACIDDDNDGNGTLSPICEKSDPTCTGVCFDECFMRGSTNCTEVDPGVYIKSICLPDDAGCMKWKPQWMCHEPCQSPTLCGEDPSCPLENCEDDEICNEACSQFAAAGCYYDPDCSGQCRTQCWTDQLCNPFCSSQYPGTCPLDPDCPSCMNREGDRCDNLPATDCCAAGETFIWSKGWHVPATYRYVATMCDNGGPCWGRCQGEPPPVGRCCPHPTDCVIWQDNGPVCIEAGMQLPGYLGTDRTWICNDAGEIDPCLQSDTCADNPAHVLCQYTPITVAGTSYDCDFTTGTWVAT